MTMGALIERLQAEYPDALFEIGKSVFKPGRTSVTIYFDRPAPLSVEVRDDVLASPDATEYIEYMANVVRKFYEIMQRDYPELELS